MDRNSFLGMVTALTQNYLITMLKWAVIIYLAGYFAYFFNPPYLANLRFGVTYGVIIVVGIVVLLQHNVYELAENILEQEIFEGTELRHQIRNGYFISLVLALIIFMIINLLLAPILCRPIFSPVDFMGIPFIYVSIIYFAICLMIFLVLNRK